MAAWPAAAPAVASALLLPVIGYSSGRKRATESATTASKPTTTDSPRPPRKLKKRKEINPTRKRHDRLSRASSQCRNCVITDGIGDLSNLCPAITEQTNPQAVFLHIRRKEKRPQTNRSDFEQAASRDALIRTSSRTRRYGDDPLLSGYVK